MYPNEFDLSVRSWAFSRVFELRVTDGVSSRWSQSEWQQVIGAIMSNDTTNTTDDIFEHYSALGEQRSYERVASEFSVAASTVKLWARSFGWQERVRERDLEIAREVADRTVTGQIDRRERSLQIVHLALVQLAKAIAEGDIRMTMADLDKLVRLEAFLSDEPESRHELVLHELSTKSDSEWGRL